MMRVRRPSPADRDGPLVDAWRATQYGVLWGLVTVAMESMAVPVDVLANQPARFLAVLTPYWCVKCVLIAWAALWLERRHRGWHLAWRVGVSSALNSMVSMAWMTLLMPGGSPLILEHGVDAFSIFCYDTWGTQFYGSLLSFACIVTRRSSRTSRLLRQAEIDRGLTDAMLAEIRLKELQGRMNPAVLHDALEEVMRRYVAGSPTADRLLDDLVGFLRTAMPSLRGSASTLGAELELTRAYLRLREELYPRQGRWRIDAAHELGTLASPPLQLVDAIDRWIAASPDPAAGVIAITCNGDATRVALHPWPADEPAPSSNPRETTP